MGTVLRKHSVEEIDLLKILLTIGIVFRHATLPDIPGSHPVYDIISKGIALVTELCVPLFFALSGYLFFLGVPDKPDAGYFLNKVKKRFFSLLVPYLIANSIAFLCYFLANKYSPSLVAGFMGDDWKNPLFIFWNGPVNLSLWFIRDLIIAVVMSPVIYLFIKYLGFWGAGAAGLVWFFFGMQPWYNFFFILGAAFSIRKVDVFIPGLKGSGPYLLLLFICSAVAAFRYGGKVTDIMILVGFPLLVWLSTVATKKFRLHVPASGRAWCFFIYLYHYIPVIALKKVLSGKLLSPYSPDWALAGAHLLNALVVLGALSLVYMLMRKILPRTCRVIIGGK